MSGSGVSPKPGDIRKSPAGSAGVLTMAGKSAVALVEGKRIYRSRTLADETAPGWIAAALRDMRHVSGFICREAGRHVLKHEWGNRSREAG